MSRAQLCLQMALAVLLVLLSAHNAQGVALGVNRASLSFDEVLRGGYAEAVVTVTTDSSELVIAEANVTGEPAGWMRFSAPRFNFSTSRPYELRVIVEPPLDTQIQDYQANLIIITGELARTQGGKLGTATRASFRIPVTVRMTGVERLACTVASVQVLDTERGQPAEVRVVIMNRGNVRVNPLVELAVHDKLRSEQLRTRSLEFGRRILPTVSEAASLFFPLDLPPAQYWATVKVPQCGYETLATFDILEPGELKDDGEFIRIDAPTYANVSDIIQIKAIFRNKGVRGVRAIFKGTIRRAESDTIVKVISTDEYVVGPDETAELLTYFNPSAGGQYIVNGKVFYNDKLTMERNAVINVLGAAKEALSRRVTLLLGMAMVIVILALLILIRRRRREHGQSAHRFAHQMRPGRAGHARHSYDQK